MSSNSSVVLANEALSFVHISVSKMAAFVFLCQSLNPSWLAGWRCRTWVSSAQKYTLHTSKDSGNFHFYLHLKSLSSSKFQNSQIKKKKKTTQTYKNSSLIVPSQIYSSLSFSLCLSKFASQLDHPRSPRQFKIRSTKSDRKPSRNYTARALVIFSLTPAFRVSSYGLSVGSLARWISGI